MTSPAEVELLNHNEEKRTSVVKITIHEGRNRQVKRMFEAINYEVIKLTRESIAGISTRGLYEGKYRKLTPEEIKYLKSL
jgi:23S rRNA pseudouridine2605 synthase